MLEVRDDTTSRGTGRAATNDARAPSHRPDTRMSDTKAIREVPTRSSARFTGDATTVASFSRSCVE